LVIAILLTSFEIPGEPGTARYAIPTYIPLATSDAANGRIWAIYLAEAEKYDKALVESWRDNVTGILIFVCNLSPVSFRKWV
jgi:hypothetical protein